MAVDEVIVRAGPVAVPLDYMVPNGTEIIPRSISAKLNGANAAGPFVPVLEVIAPSGAVTAYCARQQSIAAGASVLVSWFPGVAEADGAASSSSAADGINTLTSPQSTLSISSPTGPTTGLDLAASGAAAGTYGDNLTVPQVTLDALGRVTGIANVAIASGAGGGIVQVSKVTVTSGDQTNNGTGFADASGLTTTITTGAHRCIVLFTANAHASGGAGNVAFDLAIDGTRQGGAYGLTIVQQAGGGAQPNVPVGFAYLTDVLSAASHTFKIQWRVDGALTGTMFASNTVSPAILTVLELGV